MRIRRIAQEEDRPAFDPSGLTESQLDRISQHLVYKGYDSRGGQDALRALKKYFGLGYLPAHWAEAVEIALGSQSAPPSPETPTNALRKIIRMFGITQNPQLCGYILRDGRMLDFSGGKMGSREGIRSLDHRSLPDEYNGQDGMSRFVNEGNIRVFPGRSMRSGMDIRRKPTPAQYPTIHLIANMAFEGFHLDLKGPLGRAAREYTNVDGKWIVRDIQNFYATGKLLNHGVTMDIIDRQVDFSH